MVYFLEIGSGVGLGELPKDRLSDTVENLFLRVTPRILNIFQNPFTGDLEIPWTLFWWKKIGRKRPLAGDIYKNSAQKYLMISACSKEFQTRK